MPRGVNSPTTEPAATGTGLQVGGLTRFSTVDWPGRMTATVFCQGCAWRCRYCHNPHFQEFRATREGAGDLAAWTWPAILAWLRDRRHLLDGVVFSGGEPTLQPRLVDAVGRVRELGFRAGLHTGGPVPSALAEVLPLLDWVGFDFKAPFDAYERMTGRASGARVAESLALVRESGVACEVRTTWHPALLSDADLGAMADTLVTAGVREWVVQRFRSEGCADAELCRADGRLSIEALRRDGLSVVVR